MAAQCRISKLHPEVGAKFIKQLMLSVPVFFFWAHKTNAKYQLPYTFLFNLYSNYDKGFALIGYTSTVLNMTETQCCETGFRISQPGADSRNSGAASRILELGAGSRLKVGGPPFISARLRTTAADDKTWICMPAAGCSNKKNLLQLFISFLEKRLPVTLLSKGWYHISLCGDIFRASFSLTTDDPSSTESSALLWGFIIIKVHIPLLFIDRGSHGSFSHPVSGLSSTLTFS